MTYNVFVESPSPRATGHNAKIGDLLVRTAESAEAPLGFTTRNQQAQRTDDSASVYEEVDEIGFTYARFNHIGGEGLAWYPPRSGKIVPELDPIRYFDSRNILVGREVDDVPYRLELAKAWKVLDNAQTFIDTFASNDHIYYAHALTVTQADDWDGTNSTTYTLVGTTGPILTLFGSRGDDVCVITTEGDLFVKPRGATAFVLAYEAGVTGAALVGGWWAKGRVIAERTKTSTIDTSELVEIALAVGGTPATPTVTPTVTVLDTFDADVWSIVDASIAIVVALSNGELRSFVPQSDTAGSAPVLTLRGTTPMPTSETPYLLGFGSGKLLILTEAEGAGGRKRAYSAEVLDERFDFVIGQLQLLREWANTTDTPDIRGSMVATRNAIWWLINDTDSAMCELWHYDTISTGVFRDSEVGANSGIALATFQDRFGLIYNSEVWTRDLASYHDEGYLITPNINFGRTSELAWLASKILVENIGAASGTVDLHYSTDPNAIYDAAHPSWRLIATLTDQSQSGINLSVNNVTSQQLALKITLKAPTTPNDTPRVLRYSMRAVTTARDWIIPIVINVSDLIEVPNRHPLEVPGWGRALYQQLMSMVGDAVDVEIYDPPGQFQGIIDSLSIPVDYTPDRGSPTTIAVLTLLGSQVTGGVQYAGSNSFAQLTYGLFVYGTGESEAEL